MGKRLAHELNEFIDMRFRRDQYPNKISFVCHSIGMPGPCFEVNFAVVFCEPPSVVRVVDDGAVFKLTHAVLSLISMYLGPLLHRRTRGA
jgi:hypothetical protein